jgi:hypothetical protein
LQLDSYLKDSCCCHWLALSLSQNSTETWHSVLKSFQILSYFNDFKIQVQTHEYDIQFSIVTCCSVLFSDSVRCVSTMQRGTRRSLKRLIAYVLNSKWNLCLIGNKTCHLPKWQSWILALAVCWSIIYLKIFKSRSLWLNTTNTKWNLSCLNYFLFMWHLVRFIVTLVVYLLLAKCHSFYYVPIKIKII